MFEREIEKNILENISNEKILLILWARQVWKTTILKKMKLFLTDKKEETFYINLEDPFFLEKLNQHPKNIFEIIWIWKNKKYVFIDEIQMLDNPSNFLKLIYDEYKDNLKLIVSWSSAFYIDKKFNDSLAWRKKIFYVYTLNFREFLIFKRREDLKNQLVSKKILDYYKKDLINYYKEYITYWWYPELVLLEKIEDKKEYLKSIANSYIKKDIFEANIEYQDKYYFILKILSSQIGSLLNINEIANTINLPSSTVERYIYIMKKSFHISTIKPFYEKNIRKELTKMPKVYFFDLWIRNYFINNFENIDIRLDKWELIENLVFKNLLTIYNFDDIKFWRTQNKNEVDFILEQDKKAIEVKFDINKFNIKKYKLFIETYKEYKLECIDFENSLELL